MMNSRRKFLQEASLGMGSIGLALALHQDKMLAVPVRPELEAKVFDLTPKKPEIKPKATAMISLFMQGGPRDRKSTRLNSSHIPLSRMPSSA